ncbi:MAG: HAD-IA family hydrolase [Bacteroidales bacterium]|nr:HAD-IA family hydrolase [Bacteroidales bacterium]MBN2819360.1 HAD-IA family hydrolase [Bacteroidales bacterium]
MKTQGIVFDFDGTLVDSEPLWQRSEQEIMKTVGIELTDEDTKQTIGLTSFESVEFWLNKTKNTKKSAALLTQELNQMVLDLLKTEANLQPGTMEILEFLKSTGLPVGIASGSSMAHIKTIIDRFDLKDYFNLIYSIDFERFGKPHPGIYISACKKLKIDPLYSIAFEDSFNGMLAGKAARMKVVAILDEEQHKTTRFDFIDLKIGTLAEFKQEQLEFIEKTL